MEMITCNDYEKIVLKQIPLIDVRAPIEFEKGAFINAVNLPLMNNEERHLVGICYKEKGNEEAVALGHKLVSGEIRKERIDAWVTQLERYPESMIYCFRGGLRSQIAQQWVIETTGKDIPRLEGGYKAFRNYLAAQLEPEQQRSKPILLGGYTGSGKTILLKKIPGSIDLEGIANHRGSSFGKQVTPQPTQISFENNLAYKIIQHRYNDFSCMILEDEGAHIGKCFLPKKLSAFFNSGEFVIVNVPFEERVQITMDEYVCQSQEIYMETYSAELGLELWADYIREGLSKIKKRLGGDLYKLIMGLFEQAYEKQLDTGNDYLHKNWIVKLLEDYYDPMYMHQLQNKTNIIVFEGNKNEVLAYLSDKCCCTK